MYAEYSERYWANIGQLGRHEGSRFRMMVHDLRMLLQRLAAGASFSVDSGYSVYLLYWYKSTNTDAKGRCQRRVRTQQREAAAVPSANGLSLSRRCVHLNLATGQLSIGQTPQPLHATRNGGRR